MTLEHLDVFCPQAERDHTRRVTTQFTDRYQRAVAELHHARLDDGILDRLGLPDEVRAAYEALRHHPSQTQADYYAAVHADPIAAAVKQVCLADQSRVMPC